MTSWLNEETWQDIPGYEGKYQASTLGRIRSLDRRVPCAHGGARFVRGRILKPACTETNPHLYVSLGHGAPGSQVHQLVARTFLGPQPKGQDVRHLDGDAQNNRVDNLAYGTRTENILDGYKIGKAWRKLTAEDVQSIRTQIKAGEKLTDIAMAYNVSLSCVSAIKHGRAYSWLT